LVVFVFEAHYISGDLIPRPGETDDIRWVKPDEALNLITHSVCLQRARDLFAAPSGNLYRAYTTDPFHIVETRNLDRGPAL
jgi:hypothetical protein